MNVYTFQADLYCWQCGESIQDDLRAESVIDYGDSDTFPQGPYANGGGESDSPCHCADCGVFLENPLTHDGLAYVQQALDRNTGKPDVLAQ